MQILIIEDEQPAALRLSKLVRTCQPKASILAMLDSVERAVQWLSNQAVPDLIFMDIQLADGLSFDIFQQVQVQSPVIFTTAYDQYTLRAFKVNSVDYLLKPIDPEELDQAFRKFDAIFGKPISYDLTQIQQLIQTMTQPQYKERFLVRLGQQMIHIAAADIHYFYAEEGLAFAKMSDGKRYQVDYALEQLEATLDPRQFFRISRKVITNLRAIHKISPYFNGRLKLELSPRADFEVMVSRERVQDFKNWLDR
ncbi:MAG TPA: LytTR family DNA-binding domain-containing protein [Saprospiraceae bacterium]|nr:LytTR family DNA-binding domain-containing protein [Saprospiraceae bacterium]HMP13272.1 LytTR family DNA-binding domain-containing protein [Saprospiraceae bacterium]